MANENLKKMLELSKKMDNAGTKNTTQRRATIPASANINERVARADAQIQAIDAQMFAPYQKPEGVYDADDEMARLKQAYNGAPMEATIDMSTSKLPRGIYESITNNPLTVDPFVVGEGKMAAFTERIKGALTGREAAMGIQQRLDEVDRTQAENSLMERKSNASTNNNGGVIDYALIKQIVECAVREEVGKIKGQLLNESVGHNGADNIKALKFKGNQFLFLTESGDVYACNMEYKGKNRRQS